MTEENTNEETTETQTEQPDNPNAEARKWRLKLRDAEAERDALLEQLTGARRQIVQSALTDLDPAAMDDAGLDIDAMFEDGQMNPDLLNEQLDKARTEKPYLFPKQKLYVPGEGGRPANTGPGNAFADAFAPRNS